MKWVTRERPKTDRIACPWLIRKFIDPEPEFLYVPAEHVREVAERDGAVSYDAPEAQYTHRDSLCTFEVLVEEYRIDDPAVRLMSRIVHGADIADDRDATPQSRGLLAIAEGFHLLDLGDLVSSSSASPSTTPFTPGASERSRKGAPERRRAAHPRRPGTPRLRLRARQRPHRRRARAPRRVRAGSRARSCLLARRRRARLPRARPLRRPDRSAADLPRAPRRHGLRRNRVRAHRLCPGARSRRAHRHGLHRRRRVGTVHLARASHAPSRRRRRERHPTLRYLQHDRHAGRFARGTRGRRPDADRDRLGALAARLPARRRDRLRRRRRALGGRRGRKRTRDRTPASPAPVPPDRAPPLDALRARLLRGRLRRPDLHRLLVRPRVRHPARDARARLLRRRHPPGALLPGSAAARFAVDCARLPPRGSIKAPSLSCALPTETAVESPLALRSRDGSVGELFVYGGMHRRRVAGRSPPSTRASTHRCP